MKKDAVPAILNAAGSPYTSVGIASGWTASVWFAAGARYFSSPQRQAVRHTQPPILWVPGAISPRVKRQGREADHLLPTSAEVKNGRTIPPLPHACSWRGA
jgi:hypothetical protein